MHIYVVMEIELNMHRNVSVVYKVNSNRPLNPVNISICNLFFSLSLYLSLALKSLFFHFGTHVQNCVSVVCKMLPENASYRMEERHSGKEAN